MARQAGGSSPVIPKSKKAVRPSSSTQMFPAWVSAWNGPWQQTASRPTLRPRRMSSSPSTPRARNTANSSTGTPKSRSMQITRGPQRSG